MRDYRVDKVIVRWTIPTFDRRKAEPFPLEQRHYVLDLSEVPIDVADAIFSICMRGEPAPQPELAAPSAGWIVTVEDQIGEPDFSILKYRPLFRASNSDDSERLTKADENTRSIRVLEPKLGLDYHEDESQQPITMQTMYEFLNPGVKALIRNDVASVLSIGPVVPRDTSGWTAASANLLTHFLSTIEKITTSRWYRSPLSYTYTQADADMSSVGGILYYSTPDQSSTFEVLGRIRQLYSSDELFTTAVKVYTRHVPHEGKIWWVNEVKKIFVDLHASEHRLPNIPGYSRQRLIDTFLYGGLAIHSKVDASAQSEFANLVAVHGKEIYMSAITSSMKELASYAALAYFPIKQDLDYWIANCGFAGPSKPDFDSLFSQSR